MSWLTPKALRTQVLLSQGWSTVNSTSPETEHDLTSTYYFDGSTLRRPTATELGSSWVHTLNGMRSPYTLAQVTGSTVLQGQFSTDQELVTWLAGTPKSATYSPSPPPGGTVATGFVSGQVYALLAPWALQTECSASRVPDRFDTTVALDASANSLNPNEAMNCFGCLASFQNMFHMTTTVTTTLTAPTSTSPKPSSTSTAGICQAQAATTKQHHTTSTTFTVTCVRL
eukprot:3563974-Amphidinium_carterae.1